MVFQAEPVLSIFYSVSADSMGGMVGVASSALQSQIEIATIASPVVGVPAPIAGAGLPGMATVLAGVGLVWWRRKRNAAAAFTAT